MAPPDIVLRGEHDPDGYNARQGLPDSRAELEAKVADIEAELGPLSNELEAAQRSANRCSRHDVPDLGGFTAGRQSLSTDGCETAHPIFLVLLEHRTLLGCLHITDVTLMRLDAVLPYLVVNVTVEAVLLGAGKQTRCYGAASFC